MERATRLIIAFLLVMIWSADASAAKRTVYVWCKHKTGVAVEVGRFEQTGPEGYKVIWAEELAASDLSGPELKKVREMLRNRENCKCEFLATTPLCRDDPPECDTDKACERVKAMSETIANPGANWKSVKKSLITESMQLQNHDMACVYDGVGMGPAVEDALEQIRKNVRQLKTDGLTPARSDCRVGSPSKQTQQRCADYQALQAALAALGALGKELNCPVEAAPTAKSSAEKEICPGMGTVREFKRKIAEAADKIASGGSAAPDPETSKRLEAIADALSKIAIGDSVSNTIKWCDYAQRLLDAIDKVNAACTAAELGAAMDDLSAVSGQICAEVVNLPIAKDYCVLIGKNENFFEAFDKSADPQKRNKQWEHIDEKFKENYKYCRDP